MNAQQAKEIDFPRLLSHLGHEPVKVTKGGRELWYASPFRPEKDPSFHTSFVNGKWIWNDFGDSGGNVIDFIMRYENLSTVKDVLQYLRPLAPVGRARSSNPNQASLFSFQKANHKTVDSLDGLEEHERQLELVEAHPIQNPIIYIYLEKERKIPRRLADHYLEEVKYWNKLKGKQFFAFGMKNQSGGYEIRAASSAYNFKSALKARDITVIEGRAGDRETVNVFEGMTDFLSLLTMMNTDRLNGDALILHSVSSSKRGLDYIREQGYSQVNTFLDNNGSGQKATARFTEELSQIVSNQSDSFAPHVDLNDALRAGHTCLPSPRSHESGLHPS